jgi:periplasmic protein TonB
MLDRLLESGVQRRKSAWGGTASIVVHGALIALAVAATANANPVVDHDHDFISIIPLQPPVDDGASGRTRRDGAGSTGTRTTVPEIPTIDISTTFDPSAPGTTPISTSAGSDSILLSEIGGAGGVPGSMLGGTGVATDATVDVPVRALDDRAPAYPEMLRSAGITGEVRVQFVVDTTGRAELSSVRVVESSHELFRRAVIASLRQARFTPGEVSGHRVRTLVERSYRFDIAGGAR